MTLVVINGVRVEIRGLYPLTIVTSRVVELCYNRLGPDRSLSGRVLSIPYF